MNVGQPENTAGSQVARTPQAQEVDFALHTLGWKAFQDLCAEIAREVLGRVVTIFRPAQDGGRDAAFLGQWPGTGTLNNPSVSTIQCKFTSKADRRLRVSDLKGEEESIRDLVRDGLAEGYVLMTNMTVDGPVEAEASQWLKSLGVRVPTVLGRDAITLYLRSSPKLRALVPRVYGLGDLGWITDARRIDQARAVLQRLGDDGLATYVPTAAHRKAVEALHQHGIVMLIGEPASGKSTIAAILAANALDNEAADVVRVDRPSEFSDRWNPHETKRFFWIDDAFGANQIRRDYVDEWVRRIPELKTALSKGNRFVFTTRDYIWNEARKELRFSSIPSLEEGEESQITINLADLTQEEKEQILYNHIKVGDQTGLWRKRIAPFLSDVAQHHMFLPEIARRLGYRAFTREISLEKSGLMRFISEPKAFLARTIEELPSEARAALALMFLHGGRVPSPLSSDDPALSLVEEQTNIKLPQIRTALQNLKGSMVLNVQDQDQLVWIYKHPTIFDAYADVVARNPESVEIFLRGAKAEDIFTQVACGSVGVYGFPVRVPPQYYELLLERVRRCPSDRDANGRLFNFLAERADNAFLNLVLDNVPEVLSRETWSYTQVRWSPLLRLIRRLKEIGRLPEDARRVGVSMLRDALLDDCDATFLDDELNLSLFEPLELVRLGFQIRENLLPKLEGVVEEAADNVSYHEDAAEALSLLRDSLKALDRCFLFEEGREAIDEAQSRIESFIEDRKNNPWAPEDDDYTVAPSPSSARGARSIFDDLHE
ncbi:hypothetical protein [Microvirga vignae]|uniref:nSTAND3 domain-containing NTPase n=1 Tax=Microvirga vignae TaxID=1225564 RepID=UPI000699AF97|nr:hypothetical protein [Microvirga vignae]